MANKTEVAFTIQTITITMQYNTLQYNLFNVPYIASESEARMVFLGGHPAKY